MGEPTNLNWSNDFEALAGGCASAEGHLGNVGKAAYLFR